MITARLQKNMTTGVCTLLIKGALVDTCMYSVYMTLQFVRQDKAFSSCYLIVSAIELANYEFIYLLAMKTTNRTKKPSNTCTYSARHA